MRPIARSSNFTSEEKFIFLSIIKKYHSIINDKKTCTVAIARKNKLWTRITNEFNAQITESRARKMAQLKRLYHNLKDKLKRKIKTEQPAIDEQYLPETDLLSDSNFETVEIKPDILCDDDPLEGGNLPCESDSEEISLDYQKESNPSLNYTTTNYKMVTRFTPRDKRNLLKIIKKYKSIITDKRITNIFVDRKKRAWDAIANEFNYKFSRDRNCSSVQLKRLYNNLRKRGVATLAHHQASAVLDGDEALLDLLKNMDSKQNDTAISSALDIDGDTTEIHKNPDTPQRDGSYRQTSIENIHANPIPTAHVCHDSNEEMSSDSQSYQNDPKQSNTYLEKKPKFYYLLHEKLKLLAIIKKYSSIINDKGSSQAIKERKNKAWNAIANEFNKQVTADRARHSVQLKKLYHNLKYAKHNLQLTPEPTNESKSDESFKKELEGTENDDTEGISENGENDVKNKAMAHDDQIPDDDNCSDCSEAQEMSLDYENGAFENRTDVERIRTPNFTQQEKLNLLTIIKKYSSIINEKGSNHHIIEKKNMAWDAIANDFNKQVTADRARHTVQLKKLYHNLKYAKHNMQLTPELSMEPKSNGSFINELEGTENDDTEGIAENGNNDVKNKAMAHNDRIPDDDKCSDSEAEEMSLDYENDALENKTNVERIPTANYTLQEKLNLLTLIKKYSSIIKNNATTKIVVDRKRKAWNRIAKDFNALVTTDRARQPRQLKRLYFNLKCRIGAKYKNLKPSLDEQSRTNLEYDLMMHNLIESGQKSNNEMANDFDSMIAEIEKNVREMEGADNEVYIEDKAMPDCTPENNNPLSDIDSSVESDDGDTSSDDQSGSEPNRKEKHGNKQEQSNKPQSNLTQLKETYFKMKISNAKLQRAYMIKISEMELKLLEQKMAILKKAN